MNGLSLFTGSGIGDLVFKEIIPDYRTVCYVEWEAYAVANLIAKIQAGLIDDAPIWDDIRTFDTTPYRGVVDFVFGGFPCQPFSVAGKNKGESDERNMWPDTFRVISEIRPRYALLENVPNLLTHKYARRIFADLAQIGYDCEWDVVGASDVGANHRRERVWILAHAKRVRGTAGLSGPEQRHERHTRKPNNGSSKKIRPDSGWWAVEPNVGRVAHGISNRVGRLKILGNGWCPQVVARILEVSE